MSKQIAIQNETELVSEFHQLLPELPEFTLIIPPRPTSGKTHDLELHLDGRVLRFQLKFLTNPAASRVETIPSHLSNRGNEADVRLIVVTPRLTNQLLARCRTHQISAIDLNGRAYIRAPGILIDRSALPGRNYGFGLAPRNIFVGKSVRIIRSLLAQPDRVWVQSDLVERSQASPGLVSRIVTHLSFLDFFEKLDARRFRLRDVLPLLDAWAEVDNFGRRTTTARYSAFGSPPLELAHRLKSFFDRNSTRFALTQWIAGWVRHPYTEPAIVSAYVSSLSFDVPLEQIGLRRVNEAGNVWLYVPKDEGVFLELRQTQGLTLVSDAQIYVDLLKTGLRGPDQAKALREWRGFCRP